MSHVYLVRDGAELVCFCKCESALITFPPQLDCPWCGCGWLFTCIECRKAFTFARGVEVDEPWEELARRDLTNKWKREPARKDIDGWTRAMRKLLAGVEVGRRYVCLDGSIIAADAPAARFEGWHSRHDLAYVPQVAALTDPAIKRDVLSNPDYWRARELPRS